MGTKFYAILVKPIPADLIKKILKGLSFTPQVSWESHCLLIL